MSQAHKTKTCSACKRAFTLISFSRNQGKKTNGKCKVCVEDALKTKPSKCAEDALKTNPSRKRCVTHSQEKQTEQTKKKNKKQKTMETDNKPNTENVIDDIFKP